MPNAFELGQDGGAFELNMGLGEDFRFDAQDVEMPPAEPATSPELLGRGKNCSMTIV